jgi:Tfp pilus assembly protein PilE
MCMLRASTLRVLCTAAVLPLVSTVSLAQSAARTTPSTIAPVPAATDTVAQAQLTAVKNTLRNLVVAQERYFMDHMTYTTDVVAIWGASPGPQKPDSSVFVSVTHAGGRAWRATAQHRALKGKSCVIFVGSPTDFPMPATKGANLSPRPEQEGLPLCDAP